MIHVELYVFTKTCSLLGARSIAKQITTYHQLNQMIYVNNVGLTLRFCFLTVRDIEGFMTHTCEANAVIHGAYIYICIYIYQITLRWVNWYCSCIHLSAHSHSELHKIQYTKRCGLKCHPSDGENFWTWLHRTTNMSPKSKFISILCKTWMIIFYLCGNDNYQSSNPSCVPHINEDKSDWSHKWAVASVSWSTKFIIHTHVIISTSYLFKQS